MVGSGKKDEQGREKETRDRIKGEKSIKKYVRMVIKKSKIK